MYANIAIVSKKSVVMKGDGIGPEVVDSMLRVLKECNFQSELILAEVGSDSGRKMEEKMHHTFQNQL